MRIPCDLILHGENNELAREWLFFSGFQQGNDGKNIPRIIHLSCMTALCAEILSVLMHSGNLCSGTAS